MGLLDAALGAMLSGNNNSQSSLAMRVVSELLQQHGGIGGLMGQLQQGGLGGALNSWVGTGENQPVGGNDIESALGSAAIGQVASKLGIDPALAGTLAAQVLPQLINHATPNGNAAEAQSADLGSIAGALLKNML